MTRTAIVTASQIEALRNEAAAAGDLAMVRVCDRALAGSGRARLVCEKAIRAARASAE